MFWLCICFTGQFFFFLINLKVVILGQRSGEVLPFYTPSYPIEAKAAAYTRSPLCGTTHEIELLRQRVVGLLTLNFSDIFCIKKGGLVICLLQADHIDSKKGEKYQKDSVKTGYWNDNL